MDITQEDWLAHRINIGENLLSQTGVHFNKELSILINALNQRHSHLKLTSKAF